MRKVLFFFSLIAGTLAALFLVRLIGVRFNTQQITSIAIFSMFIYGTLLFGEFRLAFAFGGIALLLALNLLTVEGFTEAANLKVIIFLVGMFLVIGFLEENQFFEHIVAAIVGTIGPRPKTLLLVIMIMATISAALVDEVTSILFMTGTMLHLTSKYRLNPIPFVIMLVFATNIGSSASSIGNPIGVMIALNAGFTFMEFLRWSAPIALVVNIVTYFICRWWFADAFTAFADAVRAEHEAAVAKRVIRQRELVSVGAIVGASFDSVPDPSENPLDETFQTDGPSNQIDGLSISQSRVISWAVFLCTIILLMTHGSSEQLLGRIFHVKRPDGNWGLGEGTMMIGAALFMGAVVLLLRREKARELVERRVDWWTLSFFMMLFASVGTLEHTGVTRVIATKLIHSTGNNQFMLINIVGWATGWLSAFLDNVLAVATFMPVVHDVRSTWAAQNPTSPGYPVAIYWMMLFGGTFMGNMTIIGSTANIIAAGMLEKRGHGTIPFGYWFKIGFIVSIASMTVATVLLGLQTHWFTAPLLPAPLPH
jgi:Na+/H+ antiporter NhaD/arsenite permease-like protein